MAATRARRPSRILHRPVLTAMADALPEQKKLVAMIKPAKPIKDLTVDEKRALAR